MAEPINLNHARKAKAKAVRAEKAKANRVLHGTPKSLRELNKARKEKTARDLDGHQKD